MQGCVQEEIRFCLSPELAVSKLFVEVLFAFAWSPRMKLIYWRIDIQSLQSNEALVITGSERYSRFFTVMHCAC